MFARRSDPQIPSLNTPSPAQRCSHIRHIRLGASHLSPACLPAIVVADDNVPLAITNASSLRFSVARLIRVSIVWAVTNRNTSTGLV